MPAVERRTVHTFKVTVNGSADRQALVVKLLEVLKNSGTNIDVSVTINDTGIRRSVQSDAPVVAESAALDPNNPFRSALQEHRLWKSPDIAQPSGRKWPRFADSTAFYAALAKGSGNNTAETPARRRRYANNLIAAPDSNHYHDACPSRSYEAGTRENCCDPFYESHSGTWNNDAQSDDYLQSAYSDDASYTQSRDYDLQPSNGDVHGSSAKHPVCLASPPPRWPPGPPITPMGIWAPNSRFPPGSRYVKCPCLGWSYGYGSPNGLIYDPAWEDTRTDVVDELATGSFWGSPGWPRILNGVKPFDPEKEQRDFGPLGMSPPSPTKDKGLQSLWID